MPLSHIELLVEEASMEAALRVVIPKLVDKTGYSFQRFPGKQSLLRQLPSRLKSLRRMCQPDWLIMVVLDRDRDDCKQLKSRLDLEARSVGFETGSRGIPGPASLANRIAVEELEAWYFGDWDAVRAAYPRVPDNIPRRAPYRDPDVIAGGTWEAFERIMQQSGYFPGGLGKIEAAQTIAPYMEPARNSSHSFQAFRDTILKAVADKR